jgi:hypothetical protein
MGEWPWLRAVGVTLVLSAPAVALAGSAAAMASAPPSPPSPPSAAEADLVLLATQAGPRTTSKIGITVGVQNLGPGAADGVQVTIGLPELGLRLADEGSGGCRQPDPTSLVCDWPAPLQPSSAAQFSAELTRGRLAAGDVASFSFSVASTTADPNPANNTGRFAAAIYPPPVDLAVRFVRVVKPQDDAELASSQVRVELAVENKGPIAVTMVNFALSLPGELAFVSGQGGYGHRGEVPAFACAIDDPAAVSCWSLPGTMPPGRTDVIGIVLDLAQASPGRAYDLVASVGQLTFSTDPVPGDDVARFRLTTPGAAPATSTPATSSPATSTPATTSSPRPASTAPPGSVDPGATRATLPGTGGSSAPPVAAGLVAIAGGLALAAVGRCRPRPPARGAGPSHPS